MFVCAQQQRISRSLCHSSNMQNKNFDNFLFSLFLYLSFPYSHTLSSLSLSLSLSLSQSTLSLSLYLCLSICLSLSLSLSHTHFLSLSISLSLFLYITHTHTFTLTQRNCKKTSQKVFVFLLTERHLGSCDTIVNPISVNFFFLTRDLRLDDKTLRRMRSLVANTMRSHEMMIFSYKTKRKR